MRHAAENLEQRNLVISHGPQGMEAHRVKMLSKEEKFPENAKLLG